MGTIKPRNFKGTRDFPPREMILREQLIERMKQVFRLYGFNPMETPALEMLQVLSGKYGDEGEKLLYKLDYKNDRPKDRVALRYDLTVPLARVISMHPEWPTPFKRYQIQPVWRADQPQIRQGRFREFYQCDVDTIGSEEGIADAEIIALTVRMVEEMGFTGEGREAVVLLSHRKILEALNELAGLPADQFMPFCRALDKYDKIGREGVASELKTLGIRDEGLSRLDALYDLQEEDPLVKLDHLHALLPDTAARYAGIEGLRSILQHLENMGISSGKVRMEPRLARGLDYYTGAVFETILPDHPHIGSLTGGGRYDELIGLYSGRDLPAVGTTIGLDRMFAAMGQLGMLQDERESVIEVLFAAWSPDEIPFALQMAAMFRDAGISADTYPDTGKMKKPFTYADKLGIPYVGVAGPDETKDPDNLMLTLKHMLSGEQQTLPVQEAIDRVRRGGEPG